MTLSVVTEAAAEVLTQAEAKDHLRETGNAEDTFIDGLIKAATRYAENYTGSVFVTRTLKWTIDDFPRNSETALILPSGPVESITSIVYTDTDGISQTWDSGKYLLDKNFYRPRIMPAYNESWPSDVRDQMNAVEITFSAGYDTDGDDLPEDIKHAIKLIIGHWYENRQAVVMGSNLQQVPMAATSLLEPYKRYGF